MAEQGSGDRTQPSTEARLRRAREDGQVPVSQELSTAVGLGGLTLVMALVLPGVTAGLTRTLASMLTQLDRPAPVALGASATAIVTTIALPLLLIAGAGATAVMLQTQFLLSARGITPDLGRLNPKRGLSRIFGLDGVAETAKSLVKAGVLLWAVRHAIAGLTPAALGAAGWSAPHLAQRAGQELVRLLLTISLCQGVIALADLLWVRWRFHDRLRMTPQEVKDEYREAEGDPKLKARVRQIRTARARRRMLAVVPKATVVITNPTHYAVALQYERGTQGAPRVVAKGMDDVAARIRSVARQHGVAIVPNPLLARALYAVPLDGEIPAEHFKAVAAIVAYVWRLRGQARPA